MIELLILLATAAIASSASNKSDSKSENSLPKKKPLTGNFLQPNDPRLLHLGSELDSFTTFNSFESGYDPIRQVSWTRQNKLQIKDL